MTPDMERRRHPRFPVRWKAATLLGQWHIREIHHGCTLDVSLDGTNILCDNNNWIGNEHILIYLFPHTSQSSLKSRYIEVCGRIIHMSSPSCSGDTRLQIEFTDYRDDAKSRLSSLLPDCSLLLAD